MALQKNKPFCCGLQRIHSEDCITAETDCITAETDWSLPTPTALPAVCVSHLQQSVSLSHTHTHTPTDGGKITMGRGTRQPYSRQWMLYKSYTQAV